MGFVSLVLNKIICFFCGHIPVWENRTGSKMVCERCGTHNIKKDDLRL